MQDHSLPAADTDGTATRSLAASLRGGGDPGETEHPGHQDTPTPTYQVSTFAELVTQIGSCKCRKCDSLLLQDEKAVMELFLLWKHGPISSFVNCNRCSTSTCIGCGGKLTGALPTTEVEAQGCKITWCCNNGALFLIWALLCVFDQHYYDSRRREALGVDYRIDSSSIDMSAIEAIGFGRPNPDPHAMGAHNVQQPSDHFHTTIFTFLSKVLPSPDRRSSFDTAPPKAVLSMLLESKILIKAAELLRIDSLQEASKRKYLYQALLMYLRVIGTHSALSGEAMYNKRLTWPDKVNLFTLSIDRRLSPNKSEQETSSSLADCLRNLNAQSKLMLKVAQPHTREFSNPEGQDMVSMCRNISELSDIVLARTSTANAVNDFTQVDENADHFIVEAPDEEVFATHFYPTSHMRPLFDNEPPTPGRMRRLITDITILKTGLCPGIFVKFASSRVDVMKVIIVGPSDTPYENGLFEFDLFCSMGYPFNPPKMEFKVFRVDGTRINPNLHEDGEVCLSLLNTWHGDPWRPKQSTLLQVLVSIQAMVFKSTPLANEPATEFFPGDVFNPMNEQYNQGVRVSTVKNMLGWLENSGPLWTDVVAMHFKRNGAQILSTTKQWEQDQLAYMRSDASKDILLPEHFMIENESLELLRTKLQAAMEKHGFISSSHTSPQRGPE